MITISLTSHNYIIKIQLNQITHKMKYLGLEPKSSHTNQVLSTI